MLGTCGKVDKEGEGDYGDGRGPVSERVLWLLNDKVGVEGESNTSEILLQLKITVVKMTKGARSLAKVNEY